MSTPLSRLCRIASCYDPSSENSSIADLTNRAAERIKHLSGVRKFSVALTLGSGWAKAADLIGETVSEISADEAPGFNASAIPGRTGIIRSIRLPIDKYALVLGTRTHLYEDKDVRTVAHGVRVGAACGAKIIVLTNGAGGIEESWSPGTPILISDHINLTAASRLEGPTFIDLTDLYSARWREIARSIDPSLDEDVFVQFRGPHYETPAAVQMAKARGVRL